MDKVARIWCGVTVAQSRRQMLNAAKIRSLSYAAVGAIPATVLMAPIVTSTVAAALGAQRGSVPAFQLLFALLGTLGTIGLWLSTLSTRARRPGASRLVAGICLTAGLVAAAPLAFILIAAALQHGPPVTTVPTWNRLWAWVSCFGPMSVAVHFLVAPTGPHASNSRLERP